MALPSTRMIGALATPAPTGVVQEILADLGLLGLALLMFAENVFPPIPSELVLPLAGFLVSTGDLGFPLVLLASAIGSVGGSILLYELSRKGGRPFALRYGRLLRVGPQQIARAEIWFARRGPIVVLVGRCIPGVRSLVSLPAGLLRMSRPLYIGLTLIGTLIWNSALIGAGWLMGAEWERVGAVVGAFSTPVLLVVVIALTLVGGLWWWRRRARPEASGADEAAGG